MARYSSEYVYKEFSHLIYVTLLTETFLILFPNMSKLFHLAMRSVFESPEHDSNIKEIMLLPDSGHKHLSKEVL